MRRIVFALAVLLSAMLWSCTPDTSNSSWLVGSVWEANLAGRESEMGTMDKCLLKLKFNNPGYDFSYEIISSSEAEGPSSGYYGQTSYIIAPEYDYPSISLPFPDNEKSTETDLVIAFYNKGKFSEDLKTLHFDTFTVSAGFDDIAIFNDVTFTRK